MFVALGVKVVPWLCRKFHAQRQRVRATERLSSNDVELLAVVLQHHALPPAGHPVL